MYERHDFPPGTATSSAFCEDGLTLGLGSLTVRMRKDGSGLPHLATETDRERALALFSVVAKRVLEPKAFAHIEAAAAYWTAGDKALANMRLVFADLPRLGEPSDAYRLCLAEHLLDNGMTPTDLMTEVGLEGAALGKYSPDQPRVPAGNGRISGQWLRLLGGTSSFLGDAAPKIVSRLALFAAQFSVPTAVLGALFIPTPNSGGVAEGTLPEAHDVRFRMDGPAGALRLTTQAADGLDIIVAAQNRGGVYFDVRTGEAIGRDLGGQLYLDFDAVDDALHTESERSGNRRPAPRPYVDVDDPKMCPAPEPDVEHGERGQDNEDLIHARVNPIAPLPRGFGVNATDPLTGRPVFFDDCFRYAGDIVDGDMQVGDLVEAKGTVEFALRDIEPSTELQRELAQATKQLRVADGRGVRLKWYFAEEGAANFMRERFGEDKRLKRIVVGHLPWRPRK